VVREVLVILDGASDRRGCLEQAATPALDTGARSLVRHLPDGVPVGSETAIAALLGWVPEGPVDRALVEAAARGLSPGPGEEVWRVDLEGRQRLLVFAPPPLPAISARGPVRVWPRGLRPPPILDRRTVVIGAAGAATGLAALMGARPVVPAGATGRQGTDLAAKRRAALDAIAQRDVARVVVHVGAPDEASHRLDRAGKIAAIEQADRELVGPLRDAVLAAGWRLRVCPDHGCDPVTGEHLGGPVPCFDWGSA
jgi:2,3-bisphosphoglycerate-independent phosphoglycerate mutase